MNNGSIKKKHISNLLRSLIIYSPVITDSRSTKKHFTRSIDDELGIQAIRHVQQQRIDKNSIVNNPYRYKLYCTTVHGI